MTIFNPSILWDRVAASAVTPLDLRGVAITAGALVVVGAISLPFGLRSRFLVPSAPQAFYAPQPPRSAEAAPARGWRSESWMRIMGAGVISIKAFFLPGIVEEAFWRAALLPHPGVDGVFIYQDPATPWICLAGLVGFVGMHVVNGVLVGRWDPRIKKTFLDPRFLILAAVLGVGCTGAYIGTGGCLWSAVLVHWIPVAVWLSVLGGERRLRGREGEESLLDGEEE